MATPSFRLRMLLNMLPPIRHQIAYHAREVKDLRKINQRSKMVLRYSYQWLTNDNVIINKLPHNNSELIESSTREKSKGIVLYFHGGGYMVGSPRTARPVTTNLINKSRHAICYSAKYPLCQSIDKTIDHATQIYYDLLQRWQPKQIILAGDSAGGHLAISVALKVSQIENQRIKPAGLLLFSPWIDLSGETAIDDPLIYGESIRYAAQMICSDGEIPDPLHDHPELDQLPPTYLQYGSQEIISPENRKFAEKVGVTNVPIKIDEVDHVFHGFHYLGESLSESNNALERAASFIDQIFENTN